MRADAFLATLEAAPLVELDALTGDRGIVVLAPHPDDESLGCGGLIAQAVASGRDVRIIILTDGSGSHPLTEAFTSQMLCALREEETLRAAAELGLPAEKVIFLRLQDSWVPQEGPMAELAARVVVETARASDASAVLTTWRHDPHCDHKAAAAIVDLAAVSLVNTRILGFTVWGGALPPELDVGSAPTAYRLDVGHECDAKRRAILAHISQTDGLPGDHPGAFRLEEAMINRLCGPFESYFEMAK